MSAVVLASNESRDGVTFMNIRTTKVYGKMSRSVANCNPLLR